MAENLEKNIFLCRELIAKFPFPSFPRKWESSNYLKSMDSRIRGNDVGFSLREFCNHLLLKVFCTPPAG